ncbi:MAG TPA: YHYH protein [Flavobacteriales bacterium]|nr:YHYH protein [Flavobacteriales bacterium]
MYPALKEACHSFSMFKQVKKAITCTVFRCCFLLFLFLCFQSAQAHDPHDESNHHTHSWTKNNNEKFEGSFLMFKDGLVFFETHDQRVVSYPIESLAEKDKHIIIEKIRHIHKLNASDPVLIMVSKKSTWQIVFWISLVFLLMLVVLFLTRSFKSARAFMLLMILPLFMVLFSGFKEGSLRKLRSATNPQKIDSAFAPFKPNVSTYWDTNYFYVESLGIPATHSMMTGITSWQQQVPVPQCYLGANAWPIPLKPVVATTPVPVNALHFTKGAIAIASNGIPIFNPYTNTGVDAYLDGQLDNWGGHSGRADDYHYHIAPMHLYSSPELPIAYAFDGFAVYAGVEPDGSTMTALDGNHGHFWTDGIYHYHGTATAPYMIGQMVGEVTEDADNQIIPQATATPIRTPQSPLAGAVITAFNTVATDHYILTYTLAAQTYQVDYSWTGSGIYTYTFVSPSTTSDSAYTGFVPCTVPNEILEKKEDSDLITVFPNPVVERINIQLNDFINPVDVKEMSLYSSEMELMFNCRGFKSSLPVQKFAKGYYILVIVTKHQVITKKIIVI